MDVDPQLVELGVRLAESTARNTASSIATKVRTAKTAKQDREAIVALEEIITDLSQDRSELLQIAQAYKEQLIGQTISEADVEYITSQLVPKLTDLMVSAAEAQGSNAESAQEVIAALSPLLSVETFTVLQLLGFNFKEAIGEPLTELVAQAIRSRATADPVGELELQKLATQRELAYVELARDEAAYERLLTLFGRN